MLIVSLALCLSLSLFLSICTPCTIFIINKDEEGCVRRNIYYESALPWERMCDATDAYAYLAYEILEIGLHVDLSLNFALRST